MKAKILFTFILVLIIAITSACSEDDSDSQPNVTTGTVTDYDGNVYKTVKIGNQVWMAENLKSTSYSNGRSIPLVSDSVVWGLLEDNITDRAYCFYNNDTNGEKDIYGALYTFAAAVNGTPYRYEDNPDDEVPVQGVCPDGWHIPSYEEWKTLLDYLGNQHEASNKLREKGTKHWIDPNIGATNEIGFSARGGGYRHQYDGGFYSLTRSGNWWTSKQNTPYEDAYLVAIYPGGTGFNKLGKSYGYSVRCIKDDDSLNGY